MDPHDRAARLLALPPHRFVAERDALARSLAAEGDPSAQAIRKLRRPVGLAWVMNRLALDRRRDVAALLAAGDRLRAGQRQALAGGGADALRAAEAELRDRARALRLAAGEVLAEEGRAPAAAALSRLELLLRASATGPARDALRNATLEREPAVAAGDLSGFAVIAGGGGTARPAPRDATAARAAGRRDGVAAERERRARERRDEADRARARKAAAGALARARAAERRADAAARTAEAAARRAADQAARAGERAQARRARADAARAETSRREAALRELGPGGSGVT